MNKITVFQIERKLINTEWNNLFYRYDNKWIFKRGSPFLSPIQAIYHYITDEISLYKLQIKYNCPIHRIEFMYDNTYIIR